MPERPLRRRRSARPYHPICAPTVAAPKPPPGPKRVSSSNERRGEEAPIGITVAEAAHALYENADPAQGMPELWESWDYFDPPSWQDLNEEQKKWWRQMIVDSLHDYDVSADGPDEARISHISLTYIQSPEEEKPGAPQT